ncbi:MAG: DUF3429 domain-containing protein [bacterium]
MTDISNATVHTTNPREHLTQAAAALAYAGALPLIIAALLVWARPDAIGQTIQHLMIIYSGLLLAFLGGVRWGIAVMSSKGPGFINLIGAIIPLILAIPVFLLTNAALQLAIILIALPLLLLDDLRATRKGSGAPDWYLGVRLPLTIMIEAALLFTLVNLLLK